MKLGLLALAFFVIGAVVFVKQRRASGCPRHSVLAGKLALALGFASWAAGGTLLVCWWNGLPTG